MEIPQFDSSLIGQRKLRLWKVAQLRELGINPYPSKGQKSHEQQTLIQDFDQLQDQQVTVTGRLMSWREHGKLCFGELQDNTGKIQLYIKQDTLQPLDTEKQTLGWEELRLTDVGDHFEASGTLTKTQSGEISVLVSALKLLSKSLRPIPASHIGMTDVEERFRRRYLDMTLNPEVRRRFERRSQFWTAVREFMNQNGFEEINIPVLEHVTGGADAKPFVTHYDALNQDFYLRISHELPLKRLLGGGYEKVYDIGARFRNEGFSDEHLPEHVAMEWYWAYADYRDGMKLTQEMFKYVLGKVYGTLQFNIRGFEVNLDQDWPEIKYSEIIKDKFDIDIFQASLEDMLQILSSHGVTLDGEVNKQRVIDNLWKLIRKDIAGPAFLTGVPKFMSPLAKSNSDNPELTDRFHPIIAGSELANAYSELNDPVDQLDRFVEQQRMREAGDAEAQMLDIDFVEMLEYGMPPAVGFGLSERVFWFFENVTAKEGVPFPQLRYEVDRLTKEIYSDIADLIPETSGTLTAGQDFSRRIVIVVDEQIAGWQQVNAISHVAAYLGNKLHSQFATGENFVTSDGVKFPRNTQYPIILMSGKSEELRQLRQEALAEKMLNHVFIREMIDTTNDAEIIKWLEGKSDTDIEYMAVGVFGDSKLIKTLTKKLKLLGKGLNDTAQNADTPATMTRVTKSSDMLPTLDQTREFVHKYVQDDYQRLHAEMVSEAMRAVAQHLGEDEHKFALTGLVHDWDFNKWPTEHPGHYDILQSELGVDQDIIDAIKGHADLGFNRSTNLAKALLACDEFSGLLYAYHKMVPKYADMKTSSIIKKIHKEINFAAKINREDVTTGITELGIPEEEFINLIRDTFSQKFEAV